ncbi:MAG: excisionase family DNA-binding protein [Chloroflexi bacterium]|nr:excisionase family DNA-binding protein [Chloroflexota bacterium]
MNQLALLPPDTIPTAPESDTAAPLQLLARRTTRRSPRRAVGAPGYLSVRAAADQLGLQPRSVRSLIERGRLRSQRLGRMHFLPTAQVEEYRRVRRNRARRRRQQRLA